MNGFIELPLERRQLLCEEVQAEIGLPAVSLEKDFWVCWTLRELFSLPSWGAHLTFKGGTSLSKCWGLIDRFSEDIDIVIDKEFLGFSGEESPENAPNKKQQKKRLKALKRRAQEKIYDELLPALETRISAGLQESDQWTIKLASEEEDPERQSLIFRYPSFRAEETGYINPQVVIVLGARSDTEPSEDVRIQPYLFDQFGSILGASMFSVRALAAERTFWEKALLLHEETYRFPGRGIKERMARHYYDLWCLIRKGVAKKAVEQEGLFERAAEHRKIYFYRGGVDYATLRRGHLRLVPLPEQASEWRRDYNAMRGTMFFREEPTFDEILDVVRKFQDYFNSPPG